LELAGSSRANPDVSRLGFGLEVAERRIFHPAPKVSSGSGRVAGFFAGGKLSVRPENGISWRSLKFAVPMRKAGHRNEPNSGGLSGLGQKPQRRLAAQYVAMPRPHPGAQRIFPPSHSEVLFPVLLTFADSSGIG